MPPSPVTAEGVLDGETLYLSRDRGKITSYDAGGDALVENWTFGGNEEIACNNETGDPPKRDLKGIYGAPVIYQDRVFVGAYDGNVYAIDAESGECVWVFAGTNGPIVGGLALSGDVLYVGSEDGNLYGLDPSTGAVAKGPFDAGSPIWSTPLVHEGNIYFSTVDGEVFARTAEDLHPAWPNGNFKTSAGLLTDPIVVEGVLIVGGIGKQLFGLDPDTGEQVWDSPFEGGNWFWGDPAVNGDTVYFPNMDGKVYALIASTGESAWDKPFSALEAVRSAPLLESGNLTIVDREGNAFTVEAETGAEVTNGPIVLDEKVLANPALVNDLVLVVAQSGDLFELDPQGQEPPRAVQVAQ
jgi:outer membrane protein assembly factor BamB